MPPRSVRGQSSSPEGESPSARAQSQALHCLVHAHADWAVKRLKRSIAEKSDVSFVADKETNCVLIRANDETIKRATAILRRLDAEIGSVALRVYRLKRVDAVKVGMILRWMAVMPPLCDDEHFAITVDARTNIVILYSSRRTACFVEHVLDCLGIKQTD